MKQEAVPTKSEELPAPIPETPKQLEEEIFLQDWIESGFNATKAYLKRHPNCNEVSARTMGGRWLAKVDVKKVLEARGLGQDTYYTKLHEGLDATKVISAIGDSNGGSTDFVEIPDYKTRRDYHKALGKVLAIEKDKQEVDLTTGGKPLPIYGGNSVQGHDINQKDIQPEKKD